MPTSSDQQRRAFSIWLRTGRWPRLAKGSEAVEKKYNHWHAPGNGQFTFAEAGQHDGSWTGGDFTGGGGGSFGGGGSITGTWRRPNQRPKTQPQRAPAIGKRSSNASQRTGAIVAKQPAVVPQTGTTTPKAARPAVVRQPADATPYRRIIRNGYEFHIDDRQRTRLVSGALHRSETGLRSSTQQRQAGRPDRRAGDDGGHYIAPRFGGPTDAFNHFAHDANVNRGRYRVIEDQWDKALKQGRRVSVRIVPAYPGRSIRPDSIDVHFIIDGHGYSEDIKNERREKRHGK